MKAGSVHARNAWQMSTVHTDIGPCAPRLNLTAHMGSSLPSPAQDGERRRAGHVRRGSPTSVSP